MRNRSDYWANGGRSDSYSANYRNPYSSGFEHVEDEYRSESQTSRHYPEHAVELECYRELLELRHTMNNYWEKLLGAGERIDALESSIENLRKEQGKLNKELQKREVISRSASRLLDGMFWAIVIPVCVLALLCLGFALLHFVPEKASDIISGIIGFVGLGAFISVAVYIRRLGRLGERVGELEKIVDDRNSSRG